MTYIRQFDDVLKLLETRAAAIGYDIDKDERYIQLCATVTALDFGELQETAAGDKFLKSKLRKLLKCFYPEEYKIFEFLFT